MGVSVTLICKCCESAVFEANTTHNLNTMASEAGIYKAIWRPDEEGYKVAGDIIDVLEKGITDMKKHPEHYKQFDAENGWGTYKQFVPWLDKYLLACKEHPEANIEVWR